MAIVAAGIVMVVVRVTAVWHLGTIVLIQVVFSR